MPLQGVSSTTLLTSKADSKLNGGGNLEERCDEKVGEQFDRDADNFVCFRHCQRTGQETEHFGHLVMSPESAQLQNLFFATTDMKKEQGIDGVEEVDDNGPEDEGGGSDVPLGTVPYEGRDTEQPGRKR